MKSGWCQNFLLSFRCRTSFFSNYLPVDLQIACGRPVAYGLRHYPHLRRLETCRELNFTSYILEITITETYIHSVNVWGDVLQGIHYLVAVFRFANDVHPYVSFQKATVAACVRQHQQETIAIWTNALSRKFFYQ